MNPLFFLVWGYYKSDKSKIEQFVVCSVEHDEGEDFPENQHGFTDDDVFFYGVSFESAVGFDCGDFVITEARTFEDNELMMNDDYLAYICSVLDEDLDTCGSHAELFKEFIEVESGFPTDELDQDERVFYYTETTGYSTYSEFAKSFFDWQSDGSPYIAISDDETSIMSVDPEEDF